MTISRARMRLSLELVNLQMLLLIESMTTTPWWIRAINNNMKKIKIIKAKCSTIAFTQRLVVEAISPLLISPWILADRNWTSPWLEKKYQPWSKKAARQSRVQFNTRNKLHSLKVQEWDMKVMEIKNHLRSSQRQIQKRKLQWRSRQAKLDVKLINNWVKAALKLYLILKNWKFNFRSSPRRTWRIRPNWLSYNIKQQPLKLKRKLNSTRRNLKPSNYLMPYLWWVRCHRRLKQIWKLKEKKRMRNLKTLHCNSMKFLWSLMVLLKTLSQQKLQHQLKTPPNKKKHQPLLNKSQRQPRQWQRKAHAPIAKSLKPRLKW